MGCMKGITLQLKILTWPALVRGLTPPHRPLTCNRAARTLHMAWERLRQDLAC